MERHFLLLAFEVELAGTDGENEVCVVLVVYDFKRQAALYATKAVVACKFLLYLHLRDGSILLRGPCGRPIPTSARLWSRSTS